MSSAFDKLKRILALERDQGFRDRAVIGGLGRFLAYWEKEARAEVSQSDAALSVDSTVSSLGRYADMSLDERAHIVEQLLQGLAHSSQQEPTEARTVLGAPSPSIESIDQANAQPHADANAHAPRSAERGRPLTQHGVQQQPPTWDAPASTVKGISGATQERLAHLGITTARDLLYHFPRRYDDYGQLKTINRLALDDEITIIGLVREVKSSRLRGGQTLVRAVIFDGTGSIEACWFNQPYLEKRLAVGSEIAISGRVEEYLGRLRFTSPEWEPVQRELLHTGRLVPVYPLTEGIGARLLRRLIKNALEQWLPRIEDPLPAAQRELLGLMDLQTALSQMHFPDSSEAQAQARERLSFDEFLMLQMGILQRRSVWRSQTGQAIEIPRATIDAFIDGLPFQLTGAQLRAIDAILADLAKPTPMNRLLQGDVGSGKTVVAVAAILATVRAGLQAAVMAPTSVLATQHHLTISALLSAYPDIRCELLVGSLSPLEKSRLHDEIAEGQVQVVIGTHALIQSSVSFQRLGLVVVDEQHRFGVAQRGALRAKGVEFPPHVLSMSATPIPRTLALTVYGDLDVSALDEMPPNRQTVITAVRDRTSRERIYAFIASQVKQGRQAFIICPLIEESEGLEAKAAKAEYERLQHQVFPHLTVGLLHGRLSEDEKEQVMADFKAGAYQILVSTAVVEVGVDIPNATVILIEGAERFGLAQLHQFRGRVGRGEHKSYCILLSDDPSEQALQRLRVMEETTDGFVLAEKDLEWRGPGDVIGLRQHGLPQLRIAHLSDVAALEKARATALSIFEQDPQLAKTEHAALAASLASFWASAPVEVTP